MNLPTACVPFEGYELKCAYRFQHVICYQWQLTLIFR